MLKRVLKGLVWGLILAFLGSTLYRHGAAVMQLRLRPQGWGWLGAATGVTLIAHCWSGVVWGELLRVCGYGRPVGWAIATYLRTNLTKYLPGNIWHFYGRVRRAQDQGIPAIATVLSLVLESLLMAAAAVGWALVSQPGWWPALGWVGLVLGVHPRCLNPLLARLGRSKLAQLGRVGRSESEAEGDQGGSWAADGQSVGEKERMGGEVLGLGRYPWLGLGGEVVFVLLRAVGFGLAILALLPLDGILVGAKLLPLLGGFSVAWVAGLVIPGAPGGIGVFEAVAIALLTPHFPAAEMVGSIACYRLINTVAEGLGGAIAPIVWRSQN